MPRPRSLPAVLVFVVAALLAYPSVSWGQILLQTPHAGGNAVDIAYDTTDDSLWVADQFTGLIYHYEVTSLPPAISLLGTVANTFPAANPPFVITPRITGVAYNTSSDTLFVLNLSALTVREVNKTTGLQIGLDINLSPLSSDASLFGLAYDSFNNRLWTYDINNGELLNFSLAGTQMTTVTVPTNFPGEFLYGQGMDFVPTNGGVLEVVHGTTLDLEPTRSIQIDTSGNRTSVEVDLTSIPDQVFGIARPTAGTALYACSASVIYQMDAQVPDLLPPTGVLCTSDATGAVSVTWSNPGNYDIMSIESDAGLSVILNATATSYVDTTAPLGTAVNYTISGFQMADTATANCAITTGSGALLNYAPMDGVQIGDIALDIANNRLYATDTQTAGRIVIYDATTLQSLGELDTMSPVPHVGIAFRPFMAGDPGAMPPIADQPAQLVVSSQGQSLLSRVDPVTGTLLGGTVPITGVPGLSPIPLTLTWDPVNDYYRYVDTSATPPQMITIEADEEGSVGSFISACAPAVTAGVDFNFGVKSLSDGNILLAVDSTVTGSNAGVSQFSDGDPVCLPTIPPFNLNTSSIGAAHDLVNGVRGLEVGGNVLYVSSIAANSVFRLLLAATGDLFTRGDVDNNTVIDLVDALFIANYLFSGGVEPTCLDAADVNDDSLVDISDALYLIIYDFLMGPPPPAPFPTPGLDPTFLDGLGC